MFFSRKFEKDKLEEEERIFSRVVRFKLNLKIDLINHRERNGIYGIKLIALFSFFKFNQYLIINSRYIITLKKYLPNNVKKGRGV